MNISNSKGDDHTSRLLVSSGFTASRGSSAYPAGAGAGAELLSTVFATVGHMTKSLGAEQEIGAGPAANTLSS